jgi:cysteine-rich repeat protein
MIRLVATLAFIFFAAPVMTSAATIATTTTILSVSICGNSIVDDGEQCDAPGETGAYSTTIAGRQCSNQCFFGPYCGDGILQTLYTEECDDGNNDDADFCSAACKIEPAGSGGGGSSGGGSGGGGGSSKDQGNTEISISGRAYPGRTINILLDTEAVGNVQADSQGRFEFTTEASPGATTLGIWANDTSGTRSITLNSTFDVTQGAITNVNGLILPPTIKVSDTNPNPGDTVIVSGQSIPNAKVEVQVGNNARTLSASSSATGAWQVSFNTSGLSAAQYALRARSISGTAPLVTQSSFSSTLQLFLGVDGKATTPSDLSRDGKINLTDFSILIFWWNTNGGDSNPPADISGNGRVGIEDFSILLFNWTG